MNEFINPINILYLFVFLFSSFATIFLINVIENNLNKILLYIADTYIYFKMLFSDIHSFFKIKGFIINKVLLFKNLNEFQNITEEFYKGKINIINHDFIKKLLNKYFNNNYDLNNKDIRLLINYTYDNENYIFYYSYYTPIKVQKKIKENELLDVDIEIPYPMYNEDILKLYRENIIRPFYIKKDKKISLYSLFKVDSKTLGKIKLNDECRTKDLYKIIEKHRSPFNDYGILYHMPIKIKWILNDNNIIIKNIFEDIKLEIEYLNMYFDENECDFFIHKFISKNINDFYITEYMKKIIKERNMNMDQIIHFEYHKEE